MTIDKLKRFITQHQSSDLVKTRVNLFQAVRDFPYTINGIFTWPELLEEGRSGCGAKHRLLQAAYESLGYECQLCYTPYSWSDFRQIPENLRHGHVYHRRGLHVFLELKVDETWIKMDASYDPALRLAFPVNDSWDGLSDQKIGVEVGVVGRPKNEQEIKEFRTSCDCSPNTIPSAESLEWIARFNEWLEGIRHSSIFPHTPS